MALYNFHDPCRRRAVRAWAIKVRLSNRSRSARVCVKSRVTSCTKTNMAIEKGSCIKYIDFSEQNLVYNNKISFTMTAERTRAVTMGDVNRIGEGKRHMLRF